jgi:alkylhydroperoxidase family enzyme
MIDRKQRIPMRDLGALPAADKALVEQLVVNGEVANLMKVFIHHPDLLRKWMPFEFHILREQSLPFRDREIVILRIGWLNQAPYEWYQHCRIATEAGFTDDDIRRIEEGPGAEGWDAHERMLVQAADDLYETSVISDATWAALSQRYDTRQMLDLVFTIGQYNLVSWVLNSAGVPLDSYLRSTSP